MSACEAHGGPDQRALRELGVTYDDLLDFSTNVNPFGPAPEVDAAWREAVVSNYPDRQAWPLRVALAERHGLEPLEVVVGGGASQLIWLIAQAELGAGDRCLIVGPAFGEYRRAAIAQDACVEEIQLALEPGRANLASVHEHLKDDSPRLVFLGNPNNPTGWFFGDRELKELAQACAPGLIILDEAYCEFLGGSAWCGPPAPNVLLLRSMTKEYAIPGLRLGYVLGSAELLARLAAYQPPWSVSGPAQAAGMAALNAQEQLERSLAATSRAAALLKDDLRGLGLPVLPTPMHYFLVGVGSAGEWQRRLLSHGCLTRDATSFGLPQYLRIGARTPAENERLVAAWRAELAR